MPGLVRKLLIFAAVDGLILQPAPPRNHKPTTEQAIRIDYRTHAIGPLLKDRRDEDTAPTTLEAHGVVGTGNIFMEFKHILLTFVRCRTAQGLLELLPYLHIASRTSSFDSRQTHIPD